MTRFDLPIVYVIAPDGSPVPLRADSTGVLQVSGALGSGGATSANQISEISRLASIDSKTALLINDRSGVNFVGANLNLSGSATAINTDAITALDVSDYSWITFQLLGTWSATVQVQFSDDNANWFSVYFYNKNAGTTVNSVTANGIFSVPKQGKYFRLRVTAYTSGTIVAVGMATNNGASTTPVQTVAFTAAQSVDTELPSAIAQNDNLNLGSTTYSMGLGYGYDNVTLNWDRLRSAGNTLPGLGRLTVARGTSVINLGSGISSVSTGSFINFYTAYSNVCMQMVINSGTLSAVTIVLDGSLDGAKSYSLGSFTDPTDGAALFVVDKPFIYLRYRVTTITGSSPNLALTVAAT